MVGNDPEHSGIAGRVHGAGFRVWAEDVASTSIVAAAVAGRLIEGDTVLLSGGLAAGKTTFVAAVVAALGSADVVTSPTFTLANFYRTAAAPVLHIDTYRLADVTEFRDLGIEEYFEGSITLVEWGGMVSSEVLDPLSIDLVVPPMAPGAREITVSASARRWTEILRALEDEIAGRLG